MKNRLFIFLCLLAFVCNVCVVFSSCMAQLYIRTNGDYSNSVRSTSLPTDSVP